MKALRVWAGGTRAHPPMWTEDVQSGGGRALLQAGCGARTVLDPASSSCVPRAALVHSVAQTAQATEAAVAYLALAHVNQRSGYTLRRPTRPTRPVGLSRVRRHLAKRTTPGRPLPLWYEDSPSSCQEARGEGSPSQAKRTPRLWRRYSALAPLTAYDLDLVGVTR